MIFLIALRYLSMVLKKHFMADMPGWQPFTKAVRAGSAAPMSVAPPQGSLNRSNDPHGLKRLKKCQAKTPEGMMRLAGKIIEDGLPQPRPEIKKPKGPKYSEQRCVTIDPNAYRAPFNRVRSPREVRNPFDSACPDVRSQPTRLPAPAHRLAGPATRDVMSPSC
jgi:hypothetical protein